MWPRGRSEPWGAAPPLPGLEDVRTDVREGGLRGGQSGGVLQKEWASQGPVFQEVFAGRGRLSASFRRLGWETWDPIEAYPKTGYRAEHDVLRPEISRQLVKNWGTRVVYIHFGTPCSSFSILNVNLTVAPEVGSTPTARGSWSGSGGATSC